MNTDRIDFISSYCDRWCERCAYTMRCSAFATEAAMGMCGDFEEALHLAVGIPQPVGAERPEPPWLLEIDPSEPTAAELAEFEQQEERREQRIRASPLTKVARVYSLLSYRWLSGRGDTDRLEADDMLREATAIVRHDSVLIGAKLHRALAGRDARIHDGDDDGHRVQNDWNGSAKVALLSIERSAAAWRLLADVLGDELPLELAMQLEGLAQEVESEFPQARAFARPGFDEPGR